MPSKHGRSLQHGMVWYRAPGTWYTVARFGTYGSAKYSLTIDDNVWVTWWKCRVHFAARINTWCDNFRGAQG